MTPGISSAAAQRSGGSQTARAGHGWAPFVSGVVMCGLIVFMIVPEDFDYTSIGTPMPAEGSSLSRLVWLALLVGAAACVLRYASLARRVLGKMNPFLLAYVALAGASVLWSADPAFTVRRLIRLATIFLASLAFVLGPPRRVQDVLRPMVTAMLIGSIAMVLWDPVLALERSTSSELVGAWHGMATQKNGLGSLAAIGLLLWLHAWLAKESRWPAIAFGASASLLCLLYSRSTTSLLAVLFTAPVMILLLHSPRGLRRHVPTLVRAFAGGLLLYSLAVLRLVPGLSILLAPVQTFTGKGLSFSGRTEIWDIVSENIARHPFLGGGFGAYWVGPTLGTAAYEHVTRLYFYPTEAHNGYLDVINDLGALGGVFLLGYLVVYLRQSIAAFSRTPLQGALYLGLLFEQLIANMSESRWLNVLCVEFVIMTLITAALARQQLELRSPIRRARYG